MSAARRWRDTMHALGLEWRVGMWTDTNLVYIGQHNDNGAAWSDDGALVITRTTYLARPDPHHPSNLGHLLAMVCEVYGVDDVRWAFVRHDGGTGTACIWSDQYAIRTGSCLLGKVDVERWENASIDDVPLALIDALERKARKVAYD